MTGNVDIVHFFVYYIGSATDEFVNNLIDKLFITLAERYSVQGGFRLTLTSGGYYNKLFGLIIFYFVNIYKHAGRYGKIAKFGGDINDIYHTSARNRNFSLTACRLGYYLLNTVYI